MVSSVGVDLTNLCIGMGERTRQAVIKAVVYSTPLALSLFKETPVRGTSKLLALAQNICWASHI